MGLNMYGMKYVLFHFDQNLIILCKIGIKKGNEN